MLTEQQLSQLDWDKTQGMMPVIVQHNVSGEVLMHGYMNPEALEKTLAEGNVTFSPAPKTGCGPKAKRPATFCR